MLGLLDRSTQLSVPVAVASGGRRTRQITERGRLEERLSPLLSVIAGMVDIAGFSALGHVFRPRD